MQSCDLANLHDRKDFFFHSYMVPLLGKDRNTGMRNLEVVNLGTIKKFLNLSMSYHKYRMDKRLFRSVAKDIDISSSQVPIARTTSKLPLDKWASWFDKNSKKFKKSF